MERDDGEEKRNLLYSIYWDYNGIVEKKMETNLLYLGPWLPRHTPVSRLQYLGFGV